MSDRHQRTQRHSPLEPYCYIDRDDDEEPDEGVAGFVGYLITPRRADGCDRDFADAHICQRCQGLGHFGGAPRVVDVSADADAVGADGLDLPGDGASAGERISGLGHRGAGRDHLPGSAPLEFDAQVQAAEHQRTQAHHHDQSRRDQGLLPQRREVELLFGTVQAAHDAHALTCVVWTSTSGMPNRFGWLPIESRRAINLITGPMKK